MRSGRADVIRGARGGFGGAESRGDLEALRADGIRVAGSAGGLEGHRRWHGWARRGGKAWRIGKGEEESPARDDDPGREVSERKRLPSPHDAIQERCYGRARLPEQTGKTGAVARCRARVSVLGGSRWTGPTARRGRAGRVENTRGEVLADGGQGVAPQVLGGINRSRRPRAANRRDQGGKSRPRKASDERLHPHSADSVVPNTVNRLGPYCIGGTPRRLQPPRLIPERLRSWCFA